MELKMLLRKTNLMLLKKEKSNVVEMVCNYSVDMDEIFIAGVNSIILL
jgi:hypothetical protein